MPRRYFRSTRRNRLPETLETEAINSLRQQTDALLRQFTQQFIRDLQAIQQQAARDFASGGGGGNGGGNGGGESGGLGASFSSLFSAGAGFLFGRPRVTTQRGVESARSIDANRSFRISEAQAFSEASQMFTRSDKNR